MSNRIGRTWLRRSWVQRIGLPALLALPGAPLAAQISTVPVEGLRDASVRVHALTGARIVVAPGRTIEQGTLVLRDGVIAAVGAEADVKIPADARIWTLKGKTLYAGLIEPLSEVHLPAGLKTEVPTIRGWGGGRTGGARGGRRGGPFLEPPGDP